MRQAPGLRSAVDLARFGPAEIEIVNNLATIWFIAEAQVHQAGKAAFPYVFLKPCDGFREKFNLLSDVLCLFHPYPSIDSRVLEAIERLLKKHRSGSTTCASCSSLMPRVPYWSVLAKVTPIPAPSRHSLIANCAVAWPAKND